jgi:glycosyltransferase involved in cell wall biosynthesis
MVRISVLLPVYNGLPYLKESVESLLAQDFDNFDIHILDDCSTDGSWEYLLSISSDKIHLGRNVQNKGLFFNLNHLITSTSSALIKLWSQDDIMSSSCLSSIDKFHLKHPEIGFSYTGVTIIDGSGMIIETDWIDRTPEIIKRELHTRIAFHTGSIAGNIANVTISRFALDKVGMFNESMKIAGDTEMWFRIAEHFPVGFMREKIISLRRHEGQLSRQEKYYINHLKEELQCYTYLMGYSSPEEKAAGIKKLRKGKLQFYMTLMFKSFAKGDFKTGGYFWQQLSAFDNMPLLLKDFVVYKLFKKKMGEELFVS